MKKQLLYVTLIGLGFVGCAQEAPVESAAAPESEQLDAMITGTVAYGYAAVNVDVEITDQDGEEVFTGSTDNEGVYRASLKGKHPKLPLLLRAHIDDSTEFTSIVSDEDGELTDGEELHAHVNALTDRTARELLGEECDHRKLKGLTKKQILAKGTEVVDDVLGENIDFSSFYDKSEFKAAIKGRDEVVPGVHDMMLHSIDDMAKKEGKQVKAMVKEYREDRKELFENSEEFKQELADNLSEFRVETKELREEIKDFAENHPEIVKAIEERHELMGARPDRPQLDSAEREARKMLIEALSALCDSMTHEERVDYMDSVSVEFKTLMKGEFELLKAALGESLTDESRLLLDSSMHEYARELITTLQPCPEFLHHRMEKSEGDRLEDGRPEGVRPEGDGPEGDRPEDDRPEGDKPEGDRPEGDKPVKDIFEGEFPTKEQLEKLKELCRPDFTTPEWEKPEECPDLPLHFMPVDADENEPVVE